jgi:hypothetical protein
LIVYPAQKKIALLFAIGLNGQISWRGGYNGAMLRRVLSLLSIASLLVGLIICVFWLRSYHHTDHFGYTFPTSRRTQFTSISGRVGVTVITNIPGGITQRTDFYQFKQIVGGCLVIPAFWLAIWIRSKLPRPGRIRRDDYLPPLGSSRF